MHKSPRFFEFETATTADRNDVLTFGIYHLASGDIRGSIDLLQKVKFVEPAAYFYLGVAYYRMGEMAEAARYFEKFNEHRDDVWQSYYYQCLISLKENNVDAALSFLAKAPDSEDRHNIADHISEYEMLIEARRLYVEKRYDEAIDLYGGIEDFPGYREIGMALTFARMGRYKESLALLDSVIESSGEERLVQWGLFEAGKELALLQEMQKAKLYLRKYLEQDSSDEARFLMGRILSEEARYDSARAYLQDLPDSVDAYLFFKGRTEYFLGLWGKSEMNLLRHHDRFPRSPYADRALYILASINYKRKEYGRAIEFWKELADSFPRSPYAAAALQGIGNSYFDMNEYARALAAYNLVAQHSPPEQISTEVNLKIYETRYFLHEFSSLIEALRKYVRENPRSNLVGHVMFRIAKIHYEQGEYYLSLNGLDEVIKDNDGKPVANEARILRIQVSRAMEDEYEITRSLQSLLNSESAAEYRLYAANELGAFWTEKSKYDSALYYYNLLLNTEAYSENAILKIAGIYSNLGQNHEAITMIERLISGYPQSTYLVDAHILKARTLKNLGDYASAKNILADLSERVGPRPDIFMELGHLYFESEDFLEARNHYLRAGELYEQNREGAADALILAGDASVAIGDRVQGRDCYLRASLLADSPYLKNRAIQKLTALGEK
ncbi:MAG: tetratricopeptide repeat protein [candidate division WOR-3 bacterium]|nr:MAG: tetratricopeptide repeat protein [candidate division WOR-3 bacterium]